MRRLLGSIKHGEIAKVLVYKLDRLSRRHMHVPQLLEDVFEPAGVGFCSSTESFDTTTPFGKAMTGILAVFAQPEHENIRERTTLGRVQKANRGKVVVRRNLPVWLRNDDGGATVRLDGHWAPLVRRVFTLNRHGQRPRGIARTFEVGGIMPPGGGPYWRVSTLDYWLRHPAAKGVYHPLTLEAHAPKGTKAAHRPKTIRKRRPEAQWAPPIKVPEVVDETTWAAVQERLARQPAMVGRDAKVTGETRRKRLAASGAGRLCSRVTGRPFPGNDREGPGAAGASRIGAARTAEVPVCQASRATVTPPNAPMRRAQGGLPALRRRTASRFRPCSDYSTPECCYLSGWRQTYRSGTAACLHPRTRPPPAVEPRGRLGGHRAQDRAQDPGPTSPPTRWGTEGASAARPWWWAGTSCWWMARRLWPLTPCAPWG